MQPISLYLHIPFCTHRCAYCDFNTYSGLDHLIPEYIEAMCREIEILTSSLVETPPLKTIFFGGGTPSLMPVRQLENLLSVIDVQFQIPAGIETTLEANPGTLSFEYLQNLALLGVNRLSLGMQSANPRELRLLERQHDYADVVEAVNMARQVGIDNLNLDLIYGLPGQTLEEWMENLSHAVQLSPDHLSLYALTLEHGTPMDHWIKRGLLTQPDQDVAADMYEYSMEYLGGAGFFQYEISNWARMGEDGIARSCLHNLQYWRNLPYLGVGAGAHGYVNGYRTANVLAPVQYIQRYAREYPAGVAEFPRTPSTIHLTRIDERDEMAETMIMGLRLVDEGVSADVFFQRFNHNLESIYGDAIGQLIHLGLLEWVTEPVRILRLTPKGRLLGNQVFIRFV